MSVPMARTFRLRNQISILRVMSSPRRGNFFSHPLTCFPQFERRSDRLYRSRAIRWLTASHRRLTTASIAPYSDVLSVPTQQPRAASTFAHDCSRPVLLRNHAARPFGVVNLASYG